MVRLGFPAVSQLILHFGDRLSIIFQSVSLFLLRQFGPMNKCLNPGRKQTGVRAPLFSNMISSSVYVRPFVSAAFIRKFQLLNFFASVIIVGLLDRGNSRKRKNT